MGLVLKRRDNANVVKDIYGGVIDILMADGDIAKALKFTKQFLQNIIDGKIDIKKLIISKSLRAWYKIPQSIAANTNPNKYPIVGPTKYIIPDPFSGVPENTGKPIIPSNK